MYNLSIHCVWGGTAIHLVNNNINCEFDSTLTQFLDMDGPSSTSNQSNWEA
jgi:hypothetical protein